MIKDLKDEFTARRLSFILSLNSFLTTMKMVLSN